MRYGGPVLEKSHHYKSDTSTILLLRRRRVTYMTGIKLKFGLKPLHQRVRHTLEVETTNTIAFSMRHDSASVFQSSHLSVFIAELQYTRYKRNHLLVLERAIANCIH